MKPAKAIRSAAKEVRAVMKKSRSLPEGVRMHLDRALEELDCAKRLMKQSDIPVEDQTPVEEIRKSMRAILSKFPRPEPVKRPRAKAPGSGKGV